MKVSLSPMGIAWFPNDHQKTSWKGPSTDSASSGCSRPPLRFVRHLSRIHMPRARMTMRQRQPSGLHPAECPSVSAKARWSSAVHAARHHPPHRISQRLPHRPEPVAHSGQSPTMHFPGLAERRGSHAGTFPLREQTNPEQARTEGGNVRPKCRNRVSRSPSLRLRPGIRATHPQHIPDIPSAIRRQPVRV